MATRLLDNSELDVLVTYAMTCGANEVVKLDFDNSSKAFPLLSYEPLSPDQLGAWLRGPNVWCYENVNGQGSADGKYEAYRYTETLVTDALEFLKALSQYFYHCSLWTGWFLSDQREFANELMYRVVQEMIRQDETGEE